MKKFEYYTLVLTEKTIDLAGVLKERGENGWELIIFSQVPDKNGHQQMVLIFKKQSTTKGKGVK